MQEDQASAMYQILLKSFPQVLLEVVQCYGSSLAAHLPVYQTATPKEQRVLNMREKEWVLLPRMERTTNQTVDAIGNKLIFWKKSIKTWCNTCFLLKFRNKTETKAERNNHAEESSIQSSIHIQNTTKWQLNSNATNVSHILLLWIFKNNFSLQLEQRERELHST